MEQVVQPKILPVFHPVVEDAIYSSLGIERPKKEVKSSSTNDPTSPTKKAFKPMPVSIPNREREEGATPPPGEEEFGLEAVTPSSGSRSGSRARRDGQGVADDVSDASMEDCRPPEPLERICSPVSQSSSSHPPGEDRAVSALSVISSGDDLPSSAASPAPSAAAEEGDGPSAAVEPLDEAQGSPLDSSSEEDDEEDDFSSPEFEKLDPNAPPSRPTTPIQEEEGEGEKEKAVEVTEKQDDHSDLRPKTEIRDPDRKPDDQDPSSKAAGSSSEVPAPPCPASTSSESVSNQPASDSKATERSKSSTSSSRDKDKDRSRSSHHKSRRDRDKERERERDKEKKRDKDPSDRDRDRKSGSSSKYHRSDRHRSSKDQDGDRKKSSSSHHKSSDRDRERDKDQRRRDKSESDRHRSSSSKKKHRSPSPPPHPKAHLWKRPEEPSTALWDYLARFPPNVFQDDDCMDHLSQVSVSSVSSCPESDAESTILLRLSEVELDSELEEVLTSTGGRIAYPKPAPEIVEEEIVSEWIPPVPSGTPEEPGQNKRVRKANMRYSDSYVGSEFRKIITQHSSMDHQRSPPVLSGTSKRISLSEDSHGDGRNSGMSDSTSPPTLDEADPEPEEGVEEEELEEDYAPPEAKRLKAELLPSSPESVQSDPSHPSLPPPLVPVDPCPAGGASSHNVEEPQLNSPANRRRSAG